MNTKRLSLGKKLILSLLLLSISGQTFTMQNRLMEWAVFITACCFTPFIIAHLATKALSNSTPYKPIEKNSIDQSNTTSNKQPIADQTQSPYTDQELFFKAVAENNADEVKKLITTKKINVNELITQISPNREITQISALQICAQKKQFELMKILIEDGKANVNINTGCTPLHICAHNGFFEGAQLLLKNQVPKNQANVNSRTKITQNTPLHVCHNEKIAQLLIDHKADMSMVNDWQETPEQSGDASDEVRRLIAAHNFSKPIEKHRTKQTVVTQKMPDRWQQELLKNNPKPKFRSKL